MRWSSKALPVVLVCIHCCSNSLSFQQSTFASNKCYSSNGYFWRKSQRQHYHHHYHGIQQTSMHLFHSHSHNQHDHDPLTPSSSPASLESAQKMDSTDMTGSSSHTHKHSHSHGGHTHEYSHSHGGHAHTHLHLDLRSLKSKKNILLLFLAASSVVAMPLLRRGSRRELAMVSVVALFLSIIEVGKNSVNRLRVSFSSLYLGWQTHAGNVSPDQVESLKDSEDITWAGVWINLGLALFKVFAGIFGHSSAMIADAGHSLSDLLSDGVTLWAVRMAAVPPDEEHPYGHGRFEAVGAMVVSLMLLAAGYHIGNHSYEMLMAVLPAMSWGTLAGATIAAVGAATASAASATTAAAAQVPTFLAVAAAIVSIIAKEGLYQVTERVGRRMNSQVLIANAWHHRSDAISSVVALVAIVGSMMGAPMLDPLAGLFVAGMISLTGVQVCGESLKQLTDTVDLREGYAVARVIEQVPGVVGYDRIRARQMGRQTLVDLVIRTDPLISASAAQQIAQTVRWTLLQKLPYVSDVIVGIAVDEKPCPAIASLRPQAEVEADIRKALKKVLPEEVEAVPKITLHYVNMSTSAEVFIKVDPKLRVFEAMDVALRARKMLLKEVYDLCSCEVHLSLATDVIFEKHQHQHPNNQGQQDQQQEQDQNQEQLAPA